MNKLQENLNEIKRQKDEILLPKNVKKGVEYFGLVGTLEGGTPINNQDKTVTANGTYQADANYTGLGRVVVNVPTGGDTSDATAEAKDIILGKTAYTADGKVEGTFFGASLFDSMEQMREAEENATLDDMACLYRYEYHPVEKPEYLEFPFTTFFNDTIIYETLVTEEKIYTLMSMSMMWGDSITPGIRISPTKLEFGKVQVTTEMDWDTFDYITKMEWSETLTVYTSTDGQAYQYESGLKDYTFEEQIFMDVNEYTKPFVQERVGVYDGLYCYSKFGSNEELYAVSNLDCSTNNKLTYTETDLVDTRDITKCIKYIKDNLEPDNYDSALVCIKPNGTVYVFDELGSYWHPSELLINKKSMYICSYYSSSTEARKYTLDLVNHTATYVNLNSSTVLGKKVWIADITPTDKFFWIYQSGKPYSSSIYYNRTDSDYTSQNYSNPNIVSHYIPAKSQLTLSKPTELLPGVIGYGNGVITGDGTIYDELDHTRLFKIFWGEDNLVLNTNTNLCFHKDINHNQVATSLIGKHGLTEFVKVYDDIQDGCHTGFKIPTNVETEFNVLDLDYAFKVDSSNHLVRIKNRVTGDITETALPEAYKYEAKYTGGILSIWCKQSSSSSNVTVYNFNLAEGTFGTITLNYDTTYSSSYKDTQVSCNYGYKMYYSTHVEINSVQTRFVAGYVDVFNNTKTEIINTILTHNSAHPHLSHIYVGITTKKQLAVSYTVSSDSNYMAYLRLYNLDTNAEISSASHTTSTTNYFSTISLERFGSWLITDDGTYLYFGSSSYKIKKSTAEVSNGNPYSKLSWRCTHDVKYAYRTTEVKEEGAEFPEIMITYWNLNTDEQISCYVPHALCMVKENAQGELSTDYSLFGLYLEEINGAMHVIEGPGFVAQLHRLEFSNATDYDWMLSCSACSLSMYIPQFFYAENTNN